ncbi:MAG: LysR family transcriptional regulator [Catenulispora sp.]|nr:LysR family transcriptional regulator [Catenulispora sp.]
MELRDLEIFLTLAEELHFGRTAERLRLTPARVSQSVKKQERQIGGLLFDRSSHHVALTPLGRRLRDDLQPAYQALRKGLDNARLVARTGTAAAGTPLRLGIVGGGPLDDLRPVFDEFAARHPEHPLQLRSIPFGKPFTGLRRGDLDLAVLWLPVHEADLAVGPLLFTEPFVLAVGNRHRLARRESVTYEDLAAETTLAADIPDYWRAAVIPFRTPSGHPIHVGPAVADWMELIAIVANGEIVAPVHAHAVRYHTRPDIAYIPITGVPDSQWAPVWRADAESAVIRAFLDVVTDLGPLHL